MDRRPARRRLHRCAGQRLRHQPPRHHGGGKGNLDRRARDHEVRSGRQASGLVGRPKAVPGGIHGCTIDRDNNIWVTGNNDGIIQKYDPDRKAADPDRHQAANSIRPTAPTRPRATTPRRTSSTIPPASRSIRSNGDLYVADGYGNRRVVVFDSQGKYLRQFGRQATQAETDEGVGGAFAQVVHCITLSKRGPALRLRPPGRPRAGVRQERHLHQELLDQDRHREAARSARHRLVGRLLARSASRNSCTSMNGRNEQVHILDHASGKILS